MAVGVGVGVGCAGAGEVVGVGVGLAADCSTIFWVDSRRASSARSLAAFWEAMCEGIRIAYAMAPATAPMATCLNQPLVSRVVEKFIRRARRRLAAWMTMQ